ncbi:MAG: hypothetical protein EOM26_10260 [Alphaproteobacteria bacterium]|nr:hypothetical protein [Alphaproteobacteria bacterium]
MHKHSLVSSAGLGAMFFAAAFGATVAAEPFEAEEPDWQYPREIHIGREFKFFRYVDASGDKRVDLLAFDANTASKNFQCLGAQTFTAETNPYPLLKFHRVPAGENRIAISCTGECDDLHYGLQRIRDGYILHDGVKETFPAFWTRAITAGGDEPLLSLVFLKKAPSRTPESRADWDAIVGIPPGATVTLSHEHNGIGSAFDFKNMYRECPHAPAP